MRPIDRPPFAGGENPAKRITLSQTLALLSLIQENCANFLPRALENFEPFANCRRGSLAKPATTNSSRLLQALARRVGIDLLHDRSGESQTALVNLLMSFHVANQLSIPKSETNSSGHCGRAPLRWQPRHHLSRIRWNPVLELHSRFAGTFCKRLRCSATRIDMAAVSH